ncbi:unnamed protein product [Amoebophrya sp. A25]|nr:unnamed protein product [Amoebophrya sp. A25]|eukprot:GSA25T00002590001.1
MEASSAKLLERFHRELHERSRIEERYLAERRQLELEKDALKEEKEKLVGLVRKLKCRMSNLVGEDKMQVEGTEPCSEEETQAEEQTTTIEQACDEHIQESKEHTSSLNMLEVPGGYQENKKTFSSCEDGTKSCKSMIDGQSTTVVDHVGDSWSKTTDYLRIHEDDIRGDLGCECDKADHLPRCTAASSSSRRPVSSHETNAPTSSLDNAHNNYDVDMESPSSTAIAEEILSRKEEIERRSFCGAYLHEMETSCKHPSSRAGPGGFTDKDDDKDLQLDRTSGASHSCGKGQGIRHSTHEYHGRRFAVVEVVSSKLRSKSADWTIQNNTIDNNGESSSGNIPGVSEADFSLQTRIRDLMLQQGNLIRSLRAEVETKNRELQLVRTNLESHPSRL